MKKALCFAFLLFIILSPGYSQWVKMDSLSSCVWSFSSSGNHLYACTTTNGVYCSADSGISWTPCNNGLTNLNVRSMATKDSILMIGTYGGIFKSTNFGLCWIPANNGIYVPDIHDVKFRGDSLLLGSYGGGVYFSLDYGTTFLTTNYGLSDHYINCVYFNSSRMFAGGGGRGGISCRMILEYHGGLKIMGFQKIPGIRTIMNQFFVIRITGHHYLLRPGMDRCLNQMTTARTGPQQMSDSVASIITSTLSPVAMGLFLQPVMEREFTGPLTMD